MTSIARLSILGFGISAFVAGLISLYDPAQSLQVLNLPKGAIPAVRGNALAAIAMGIYYTLAAYQNNVLFFYATVPMRGLTCVVFWLQGWHAASAWEGAGSVITALALVWRGRDAKEKRR